MQETAVTGAPEPVLPDYEGACISNLVPALLACTGPGGIPADAPAWLPPIVAGAPQVVLLVIDGLGWEQVRERAALTPTLSAAAGIDQPATSVVPTTTAAALTSIGTGRPPSVHGLLGYRLAVPGDEILNVLRWQVGTARPRDARQLFPVAEFQPTPPFPGASRPVPVVLSGDFGSTGFTAAQIGDSPIRGYRVTSSMVVALRQLLAGGEPLIYAYYDGIDKVAHEHGLGAYYDQEVRAVDRLIGDITAELPPGAVLVVTADHGQVDIGPSVVLPGPELMGATRFLSGEGRFRWFHARPGATGDLLEAARGHHGSTTWVASREQVVDEGWFGGPLRAGTEDRLGDVALIPHAAIAYTDPADTGETRLAARHGSLTAAEMLVPLLALGGDGNIGT